MSLLRLYQNLVAWPLGGLLCLAVVPLVASLLGPDLRLRRKRKRDRRKLAKRMSMVSLATRTASSVSEPSHGVDQAKRIRLDRRENPSGGDCTTSAGQGPVVSAAAGVQVSAGAGLVGRDAGDLDGGAGRGRGGTYSQAAGSSSVFVGMRSASLTDDDLRRVRRHLVAKIPRDGSAALPRFCD